MKRLAKKTKKLSLLDSEMLDTLVVEATRGPETSLHFYHKFNFFLFLVIKNIWKLLSHRLTQKERAPSYYFNKGVLQADSLVKIFTRAEKPQSPLLPCRTKTST